MIKQLVGFVLVSFLLLSCSSDSKAFKPLPNDAVILAFGDSLTVGVGASSDKSYPAVLQNLSGLTVINNGVSGSVSSEGLDRLQASLDEYSPNLVIICYGGNDILRNKPQKQLKANLARMIEKSQGNGAEVVLIAVPKKSLFLASLPLYKELAEQYDVPIENEVLVELLGNSSNRSDTVHLNAKGYRMMAEAVYELLQQPGALD